MCVRRIAKGENPDWLWKVIEGYNRYGQERDFLPFCALT